MKKTQEIIDMIIDGIDLETFISQRKVECINANNEDRRKIGINRLGRATYGGITSASNDFIDEDRRVGVENGIGDIRELTTGNIDEVYHNLFNKIKMSHPKTIEDISSIIFQTVNEYFGEHGDLEKRLEYLPDIDEGIGQLVDLKDKNAAACVERATLSQNLMKMLGIDSTIKQSSITITEKGINDCHAYNIIHVDGQYYIFDSALPIKSENGEKNPLVGTIVDKEYDRITDGSSHIGCKTSQKGNGIIYDCSFPTLEELQQIESQNFTQKLGKETLTEQKDSDEKTITEKDLESHSKEDITIDK